MGDYCLVPVEEVGSELKRQVILWMKCQEIGLGLTLVPHDKDNAQ